MSQQVKERVSQSKFLERFVWGTTFTSRICDLSIPTKQQRVRCTIFLLLVAWNELRQEFALGEITPAECQRWRNAIGNLDVLECLATLKTADDLTLRLVSEGKVLDWSYDRFKRDLKEAGGRPGFLIPIIPLVKAAMSSSGDIRWIRALHQCFFFAKKVSFVHDERACQLDAVEHFCSVDREIRCSMRIEGPRRFFEKYLNDEIRPEPADFRHGSGRTAEVRRHEVFFAKDMCLGRDDLIEFGLRQLNLPNDLLPFRSFSRVGELLVVPKDATKGRTIVAEPTTCQWWQQGCASALWRYIENHPYLSRRIDQEKNGYENNILAREGSVNGDFATIDLSDASDTVYWPFLLQILAPSQDLQAMCIAGRTGIIHSDLIPGDGTIAIRKFAGMGSALTFPIECLVFCAIVEEAIELSGGNPHGSRYHVHGDDIVVETHYAEAVLEKLTEYGFKPNLQKSFYKRNILWNFRESCGGEFLDGESIAPIRLSRNFSGWPEKTDFHPVQPWPASLVDLINTSFCVLDDVRRTCIRKLFELLPKRLWPVFDYDGTKGIKSFCPSNFHLEKRYNSRLQRMEVRCGRWRSTHRYDERHPSSVLVRELPNANILSDYCLGSWLYEWLREAYVRSRNSNFERRCDLGLPYDAICVEGLEPLGASWAQVQDEDPL